MVGRALISRRYHAKAKANQSTQCPKTNIKNLRPYQHTKHMKQFYIYTPKREREIYNMLP